MTTAQTDLDAEVRRMLEGKRGHWSAIATEMNVSHSWLSKFVRKQIPNPGYVTLKRLHEHLTSKAGRRA